jgi:hypothetical protein
MNKCNLILVNLLRTFVSSDLDRLGRKFDILLQESRIPAKAMQVSRLSTRVLKSNTTFYSYLKPLQRSMSFSSSSSSASSTPPTPRPSASLVIVNERNEILLVRRNPKATAFGGMHVR